MHKQQFNEMEIGDAVEFKVNLNSKGQPQARDVVKVAHEGSGAAKSDGGGEENARPERVEAPDGKAKFSGTACGCVDLGTCICRL